MLYSIAISFAHALMNFFKICSFLCNTLQKCSTAVMVDGSTYVTDGYLLGNNLDGLFKK